MSGLKHLASQYPELLVFAALALGFFVGRWQWKSFSLGAVTGCLLAGLLIGQLGVQVNATVKNVAFLAFLFALGYRVGPQFVRGLSLDSLPQLGLTVLVCVTGLLTAFVFAKMLRYDIGLGAGMMAGALTQSAAIGVAQQSIAALPGLSAAQKTSSERSWHPAPNRISSGDSPGTAPTGTSSLRTWEDGTSERSGPRASSGSPCLRSCCPSARRSRSSAALLL